MLVEGGCLLLDGLVHSMIKIMVPQGKDIRKNTTACEESIAFQSFTQYAEH